MGRSTLKALRDAYPNMRFLLNTRPLEQWLARRLHNCWPQLADPSIDWLRWLDVWQSCCGIDFGIEGNPSCWHGRAGLAVALPRSLPVKSFGFAACCGGLPYYVQAWNEVHDAVAELAGPEHSLLFQLQASQPWMLSALLGLEDQHDDVGWRRIHAYPRE